MNLQRCRVVLRPRNPLDCLDLTLVLIRDQFRPIFRLFAVMVLPVWFLMSVGVMFTSGHWIWLVLSFFLGPILQVPFTILAGRLFFSGELTLAEIFKDVWACRRGLIAWAGCESALFIGSALLCFIPLPLAQSMVLFMGETVLLERVGVSRSVSRTFRLATQHLGLALFGSIARLGLVIWMALCTEALGQFVIGQLFQMGSPLGAIMEGEVTPFLLLGLLSSHCFFALFRLILYMDVRTRMEGWDLQVAFRSLALAGER